MKKTFFIISIIVAILFIIGAIFILLNKNNIEIQQFAIKNRSMIKSEIVCQFLGGKWHAWSIWQGATKACDMPYPDGDEVCQDSLDCISKKCLYIGENPVINSSANGKCAKWTSTSCVNHNFYVRSGKIVSDFCLE